MRPTWHFVAPADIRWMPAPPARASTAQWPVAIASWASTRRPSVEPIRRLRGRSRAANTDAARSRGGAGRGWIAVADGSVLSHLLSHAEIDRSVAAACAVPQIYALLDERVPAQRRMARDEAVAELACRYFASHGPATLTDFAWWSALTVGDGRRGLETHGGFRARPTG
jgi:hypothetical protein